jgi:hypothetical protein
MSCRIAAIAATSEPFGKITLFVGATSGGVWKSDANGTVYFGSTDGFLYAID